MKYILFSIQIILLFATCNSKSNTSVLGESIKQENDFEQVEQIISKETRKETREQLENMTLYEIIDLYIQHNNEREITQDYEHPKGIIIFVGDYKQTSHLGYFEFITYNEIKWYRGSGGVKYIPYIYIIDDSTINIEVFVYFIGYGSRIGEYISTGKYYITITKEDLINHYFGDIKFINNFFIVDYFNTNRFESEELFYNILINTDIFINGSLHEDKIASVQKNTKVEVVDMFYNDQKDNFPFSVKIKTDKLTGWIDVNHVDFIKREVKGTVNGIWLHNSVKNIIKNYGNRAVGGKIVGDSIPVRKTPTNNAEQLYILSNKTELFITEVSSNLEVINEIEAAWYKVYKFVEHYTENMEPSDYEIIGWVFGANFEINVSIYDDNR